MQDSSPSIYDILAPRYVARGIFPTIVAPGTKAPSRYNRQEQEYRGLSGWSKLANPIMTPQPGAGIGVRCGDAGLVALDYDDDEAALRLSSLFPESPVNKVGQRGWTAFYHAGSHPVPSENIYDSNGRQVAQILSSGRHTVMPPSIHPDTQEPYRYTNGRSLEDIPPSELPLLPQDYRERILALGFFFGKATKTEDFFSEEKKSETGNSETEFAEINAAALANRAAWVPALGLYKCKRGVGRGGPYTAVATWRESTEGRALEDREPNLKIHQTGIRDFGDGRTYSALDLVMAKRGGSVMEAFLWLEEHLSSEPKAEVDWDKIIGDAPPISPEGEEAPKEEPKHADEIDPFLGRVRSLKDPLAPVLPMLIPHFIPLGNRLGYLGAQFAAYKTFLLGDLGVAIASGTAWAGQPVAKPGYVLHIEVEGSELQLRGRAAVAARNLTADLPVDYSDQMPPTILRNGRPNPDWIKWCDGVAEFVRRRAKEWGVAVRLITLDAQNRFAGFRDEQSSAEGNVVINGLLYLIKKANCGVLVADHLGKDASAGLRGTSVKHDGPYYILSCGETAGHNLNERRLLSVFKMKGGKVGVAAPFHMKEFAVEAEQEIIDEETGEVVGTETKTHGTLVVRWEGGLVHVDRGQKEETNKLSEHQDVALAVLNELIGRQGVVLPEECAAAGMRGVQFSVWRDETLGPDKAASPPERARFGKTARVLREAGLVKIKRDWAWVCLPESPEKVVRT